MGMRVVRGSRLGRKVIAAYRLALRTPRRTTGGGAGPNELSLLRDRLEPGLRRLVAGALGVIPSHLVPDTSLVQDLAVDSLDLLDLVMRIEEDLDIVFPEREVGAILTYGDLVAATTALVACRLRAADVRTPTRVEVRIGSGDVPRFLRVINDSGYDRELVRGDLRSVTDPVTVSELDGRAQVGFDRELVCACLDGADIRTAERAEGPAPHPPTEPIGRDEHEWPASRLVERSLALVDDIRTERDRSLRQLAGTGGVLAEDVDAVRAVTSERVAAFRRIVATYLDVLDDSRPILRDAARELGRLELVRRAIDERTTGAVAVGDAYDCIADALLCYVDALQSAAPWTRTRLPPRGMAPQEPSVEARMPA